MVKYVDISLPISPALPTWPGAPPVAFERRLDMARGDAVNDTNMFCNLHVGTHIDAPLHHLADGLSADRLPLDSCIGPALVADASNADVITAATLDALAVPPAVERLLLRTRNSQWWAAGLRQFRADYVALTADAARWIVDRGIRLIGVDYLSVQRYEDGPETHRILLRAGVIVLEGITLAHVSPGPYELICLPLKLVGVDGAPARAILKQSEEAR